jgi:hypothetical protein
MPTSLACRICGRVVYATAALDALTAEESRCPRCGGVLFSDRRAGNRRKGQRRQNPAGVPGPPSGIERRVADRRRKKRRRDDGESFTF